MAARGIRRFGSTKEFAGKRRDGGGGGAARLTNWKDKGFIDVWMHTRMLPIDVFRHSIPMPIVFKDKITKEDVRRIWNKDLVCHETPLVLEKQYFHKKDDPLVRQNAPERCGICKLVEWCWLQCNLYEQTRDEKDPKKREGIELTTKMFYFENEDKPEDERTIHIGGVCNLLGKKDKHTDAQKASVKKAKIRLDEVFKENFYAKLANLVAVVEDAAPENGVIVTAIGSGLGGSIRKMMDRMLENNRDIQKKPYCMRWKYDSKALIADQYTSTELIEKKPDGRILAMIRGPEPEIPEYFTEPFNQQVVKAVLEKACTLPAGTVPWDELFPTREQEAKWKKEDDAAAKLEAENEAAGDDEEVETEEDEDGDEEPEFDADGDELVECECGKPMKAKLATCPNCKRTYDVGDEEEEEGEGAEEEEEPAPAKPGKAAAKAKKDEPPPPAPKKMRKRAGATSAPSKAGAEDDEAQGDGIPF